MSEINEKIRLPPLRSLQVFEVAARHGSFTRAAQELGVTQGAVSHQVRELEGILQITLFRRDKQRLELTEKGRQLGEAAGRALGILEDVVLRLKVRPMQPPVAVTLSMLPSLAAKWLAPRLDRFADANPEIDLRVTASRHLVDFESEQIDVAVRYGPGNWPGTRSIAVRHETIVPVCSPQVAKHLREPSDLTRMSLLHGDLPEDWDYWLAETGTKGVSTSRGQLMSDDNAVLQAAIEGHGVALARSLLVAEDCRRGALVVPWDLPIATGWSWWLVLPENVEMRPALEATIDWIVREVGMTDINQM